MHKISDEFKLRPDQTSDYGVSCPWVSKTFPILIMGKWCLHASSFIFDWIIKVAGNQDNHKSLVKFDFRPDQTTHIGVTCPWVTKISHFWTWISLKPVGQSGTNFMCSIIRVGERMQMVLGQIGSKLWFPWQQVTESPNWLTMGKMMSPLFLGCFWSYPF